MGPSTLSSWALLIARTLAARGIDAENVFRRAGIAPDKLQDPTYFNGLSGCAAGRFISVAMIEASLRAPDGQGDDHHACNAQYQLGPVPAMNVSQRRAVTGMGNRFGRNSEKQNCDGSHG